MAKRYKMNKRKSKRQFRKSVATTHKKNFKAMPMRGGYRL